MILKKLNQQKVFIVVLGPGNGTALLSQHDKLATFDSLSHQDEGK